MRGFENDLIVLDDVSAVTEKLLETVGQYSVAGKKIHDANIVATMPAFGIFVLLTHNNADFIKFSYSIDIIALFPGSK